MKKHRTRIHDVSMKTTHLDSLQNVHYLINHIALIIKTEDSYMQILDTVIQYCIMSLTFTLRWVCPCRWRSSTLIGATWRCPLVSPCWWGLSCPRVTPGWRWTPLIPSLRGVGTLWGVGSLWGIPSSLGWVTPCSWDRCISSLTTEIQKYYMYESVFTKKRRSFIESPSWSGISFLNFHKLPVYIMFHRTTCTCFKIVLLIFYCAYPFQIKERACTLMYITKFIIKLLSLIN